MPLIMASAPALVGLLAWSVFRFRMPPELVAIVATFGLPLAGLWDLSLIPWAAIPQSWPLLGGWMVCSIGAVTLIRVNRTAEVFLLGAVAGAFPAACVAAHAAADSRSAGRLAVVAAGGAAMSPLGGPLQWAMLPEAWSWWFISAPAGALAAAVCWRNNAITKADTSHVALPLVRVRWLLAALWMGTLLHIGGLTWACLLYTSPSPRDQRGSRMPSSA